MIISYLHNFIFIKTRKTAGSSMEVALATHAGPDDIVTPLGLKEEIERIRLYPDSHPRNFSENKESEKAFIEALRNGDKRGMGAAFWGEDRKKRNLSVQRHGGAKSARKLVGEDFWNSAFKFTIERHPYEKAVSLAWFARGKREFSDALEDVLTKDLYRNFELYSERGKSVVDFIIRYENLAEDVQRAEQGLGGLPILSRLPKANAAKRRDRRPASEVLTDKQKAIVYETCREEFDLMGYER